MTPALRVGAVAAALGALVAGCSSGTKRATVPPTTTTARSSAASSSTARGSTTSRASACATTSAAAPASGGKDTNPPGDIPDNQAFVAFSPPAGGYSIKVPEGWARTEGSDWVSFTDKLNTVRLQLVGAARAPTLASAEANEVPALAATAPCFQAGTVKTVSRQAGPAVLITYRADAPADPVTGKVVHDDVERYELWRGGTEAIITLSGPAGSDNVDPWRLITNSFSWR
jgi:hypothetical protein